MAKRYHVGKDGQLHVCVADEGNCPLSGSEEAKSNPLIGTHYTSVKEGNAAIEANNKKAAANKSNSLKAGASKKPDQGLTSSDVDDVMHYTGIQGFTIPGELFDKAVEGMGTYDPVTGEGTEGSVDDIDIMMDGTGVRGDMVHDKDGNLYIPKWESYRNNYGDGYVKVRNGDLETLRECMTDPNMDVWDDDDFDYDSDAFGKIAKEHGIKDVHALEDRFQSRLRDLSKCVMDDGSGVVSGYASKKDVKDALSYAISQTRGGLTSSDVKSLTDYVDPPEARFKPVTTEEFNTTIKDMGTYDPVTGKTTGGTLDSTASLGGFPVGAMRRDKDGNLYIGDWNSSNGGYETPSRYDRIENGDLATLQKCMTNPDMHYWDNEGAAAFGDGKVFDRIAKEQGIKDPDDLKDSFMDHLRDVSKCVVDDNSGVVGGYASSQDIKQAMDAALTDMKEQ